MAGDRRDFRGAAAALAARWPIGLLAQQPAPPAASSGNWDRGRVRHLLPAVSDSRTLVKASFSPPLAATPTLRIGDRTVRGRMDDTAGECWQFYADGLGAGRRYRLSLNAADGTSLCEPWELSTFRRPMRGPSGSVKPIQQHGFTLLDFTPQRIVARMFRWDVKTMPVEAIDRLEPFYTTELAR